MFRIFGSNFSRGLAATIVTATLSFAVTGCGSSDTTTPPVDSGPPAACTEAEVMAIFAAPAHGGCIACHDSVGTSDLDLKSAGLAARLLDKGPVAGGTSYPSVCLAMNKVYLMKGSNPAAGLLIDKLSSSPGCGVAMPAAGSKLSSTELACVKSWALSVTTAP